MSDALLDRTTARRVLDEWARGNLRWIAAGVAGGLGSLALTMGAIPLGDALGDAPMAGVQLAIGLMSLGGVGMVTAIAVPALGLGFRYVSWKDRVAEAKRLLAEPAPSDPAWLRLERLLRACAERAPDDEVRGTLARLHALLEAEARLAIDLEPGSEADHRHRDRLGAAERAVRRLHDQLARPGEADLADLVALLDARAEVESPAPDALARARAAARARRGESA